MRVAQRLDVALPTPLPTAEDAEFGGFMEALDGMGYLGGNFLFNTGAFVSGGNASRLEACSP